MTTFETWWRTIPDSHKLSNTIKLIALIAWNEASKAYGKQANKEALNEDTNHQEELFKMQVQHYKDSMNRSLRDEFALSVANTVFSRVNADIRTEYECSLEFVCEIAATECYEFADAMLLERNRVKENE